MAEIVALDELLDVELVELELAAVALLLGVLIALDLIAAADEYRLP